MNKIFSFFSKSKQNIFKRIQISAKQAKPIVHLGKYKKNYCFEDSNYTISDEFKRTMEDYIEKGYGIYYNHFNYFIAQTEGNKIYRYPEHIDNYDKGMFFIQQCADQKAVMDLSHDDIPKFKIDEENDKLYFYGWKVDDSFDIDSFETPDYIEIEVDKL